MLSYLKRDSSWLTVVWLRADGFDALAWFIPCPTERVKWVAFCRKSLRADWTWLESYTGHMPNASERNAIMAYLAQ